MMRACISVMVCLAVAKVQHKPSPHRSRIRSIVQEGSSSTNFVRLKGGGIASPNAAVLEPKNRPDKSGLTMAFVCVTIVSIWIGTATLIFARNEDWPLAQSLFYAVDTGMSIGFGAVSEKKLSTKLFTIVHVLLGASAVGGAIALFAESVVESSPTLASDEYTRAALSAAFSQADKDKSGTLSVNEMKAVLANLGLEPRKLEGVDSIQCFDKNGDGKITVGEFCAAVEPHLVGGVTVEQAVLLAVRRQNENAVIRVARAVWQQCASHRTLVLWCVWIVLGAIWWISTEGGDPITALYFAVGSLATGGLQAPTLTTNGTLPDKAAAFVALYCLSGVPIFAMALGKYAHIFVAKLLTTRERRNMDRPITPDEYAFAQQLFKADHKVDLSEYMALELLRLGREALHQVDVAMLKMIKSRFTMLDHDGDGKLTRDEVLKRTLV